MSMLRLTAAGAEEGDLEEVTSLLQVHTAVPPMGAGPGSEPGGPLVFISRGIVQHIHIPKTAGTSFMRAASDATRLRGLTIKSTEGCLAPPKSSPPSIDSAIMFRKPRAHVLSQFDLCRPRYGPSWLSLVRRPGEPAFPASFEVWLRQWKALKDGGWHGDFTPAFPYAPGVINYLNGIWGNFPLWMHVSPYYALNSTAGWAHFDGGGTLEHFTDVPYNCYVPISMQAQRLTCHMPLNYSVLPSADLAVSNMKGSWFVGLVEAYQASICLFHVKLGNPLPSYCNCKDPQRWNSYNTTKMNVNPNGHRLSDFSPEVIRLIDDLTEADRKLYNAARLRFVSEIRQVEKTFNTMILCDESVLLP